ncbi:YceD family protein [Agathobacter ruminis]|uniref:YceD family protein n=1 Tax=Agathobacter ruminis TaxID=1712665 RepID=UPI00166FC307|nr:DUF177 domain-containing protein [Agathobacter ruminis]MDC7300448.1 DUF177 domain-containing protein [Agathobacter ruminis]
MIFDITDVIKTINKKKTYEAPIELETFSSRLGDFPITKKAPVNLTVENQEDAALLVSGTVELTMEIPCDRCLEPVPTDFSFQIDKKLKLVDGEAIDEEMEETDYLIGFEMDVDKLIYAEILVNWPMKVLCKDDCKGICKVCGMNLNAGTCKCDTFVPDPRMAAIQDIFKNFKEV